MSELPSISEFIWDAKYRLKTFDGTPIDQTVDDTWRRVAKALAQGEIPFILRDGFREDPAFDAERVVKQWEDRFYEVMVQGLFSPAGRIIAGAGSGRNVTLSNCFTMGTIPDSMDGIFTHLKEAALTMQQGGGIGYDFSTIRPKGAEVKGVAADASGPLTFMDVWDAMCRTVMSAGSRRGAMMATMRCDHPDIEAFIEAKRDPAKLRMFNLSVLVTDEFMEAVKAGHNWRLHFENRRGETLVEKIVDARALWNKIMESTYAYAEPGVIFIDRVNQDHNLGYLETIATTNPCGEKPMGPYASCLLGSINLAKLIYNPFLPTVGVNHALLRDTVRVAIRMMDNVIEVGQFPLPAQLVKAKADRQLGLGVTGLADALIMCGLTYGTDEAASFTSEIMQTIAVTAYETSCELAAERGAFPTFNADEFLKPTRFAGRMLPNALKRRIKQEGIRNGLLISIAPTGTISMFAGNVSSGIEPVFAFSYDRKVLQPDGSHVIQTVEDYAVAEYRKLCIKRGNPADADKLPAQFVSAQTLTPEAHVKMQAAAQRWVDSSISKTINCPEDISFDDFKAVYMQAYDTGCKGCTTYRPNDVTGSVLSVKEEPKPMNRKTLVEKVEGFLRGTDPEKYPEDYSARRSAVSTLLGRAGVGKVLDLPEQFFGEMAAVIDGWGKPTQIVPDEAVHYVRVLDESGRTIVDSLALSIESEAVEGAETVTAILPGVGVVKDEEGPQERPEKLEASVYKIKIGGDPAIYVTISDILSGGQRRPFEVFINTKNPEHIAWSTALTRMVSAIFRRPHDSSFVVEELKNVFDPKGGGFWKGQYRPSVVAAIGQVLEDHMRAIGYGSFADTYKKTEVWDKLVTPEEALAGNSIDRAQIAALAKASCPSCGSLNWKRESGCEQCLDCGHSKCG